MTLCEMQSPFSLSWIQTQEKFVKHFVGDAATLSPVTVRLEDVQERIRAYMGWGHDILLQYFLHFGKQTDAFFIVTLNIDETFFKNQMDLYFKFDIGLNIVSF